MISTSAGLRAPSFLMRSMSASSPRLDAIDLDAGLLGEVGVERLVGLVVARRVEVEDLVLRDDGAGQAAPRAANAMPLETVHGDSD